MSDSQISDKTESDIRISEKMELLIGLYEQLDQNHHHHNKIIYRTFYLSIIFFGAILSVVLSATHSDIILAGIVFSGGVIMFLLGTWAYMYLKARRQIKECKSNIIGEFKEYDDVFDTLDGIEQAFFFKHDKTIERTFLNEVGWDGNNDLLDLEHRKDVFQWGYFFILGLLLFIFSFYLVYTP